MPLLKIASLMRSFSLKQSEHGKWVHCTELISLLSSTLLFAGTDTTSSALSRVLVKLSENPAVQAKLREEFLAVENLTYDALVTLPYLDAVCKETLRLQVLGDCIFFT